MSKKSIVIISVVVILVIAAVAISAIWMFSNMNKVNLDNFTSGRAYFKYGDTDVDKELSETDLKRFINICKDNEMTEETPISDFSDNVKLVLSDDEGNEHTFLISTDGEGLIFWRNKGKYFEIATAKNKLLIRVLEPYGFVFPCEEE